MNDPSVSSPEPGESETAAATGLDAVRQRLSNLPGPDEASADAARAREPRLTKPPGSLGRLESLSAWLSAWQGRHPPEIRRPRVAVFVASHGITRQAVSAYPAEVTRQMVQNFRAGGAAINQLCREQDAELRIYDAGVDRPTRDFSEAPAMDEAECAEAMALGASVIEAGIDLVCVGEMGIGNTTAAAALCHGLYGEDAALWVGPGTGVEGTALAHKVRVVADSVARHRPRLRDGLDVLRCLGGRELAAIAGTVLAAREARVPVVLDGYVSCAAAAALHAVNARALDHCLAAHLSAEPGHRKLLDRIGREPLLDLGMRLGECSGAALAIGILRAAVACHTGMATFEDAGVSDKG